MDFLFGFDKSNAPSPDLELLITVNDRVYQSIVESILKDNEIPYLSKERGSGSAVKIITGLSMFGTDIFVLKSDFERASELMEMLKAEPTEDISDDESEAE